MKKEIKFLTDSPHEMAKYKGEYIAVVGDKVVSHGKDFKKVAKSARKISKKPVFSKIPKEDVVVYHDRFSV